MQDAKVNFFQEHTEYEDKMEKRKQNQTFTNGFGLDIWFILDAVYVGESLYIQDYRDFNLSTYKIFFTFSVTKIKGHVNILFFVGEKAI